MFNDNTALNLDNENLKTAEKEDSLQENKEQEAVLPFSLETKEEEKTYIDASDDDFGLILNCAVRYSMGRETYMPHAVMRFITPLLTKLTTKTLVCMDRDLDEPSIFGGLGHERIDAPAWRDFHAAVKQELESRGERSDL